MPRDNFTEATKELLAARVGYKCSSPFCRRSTIGPQIGDDKTVSIGEAAHICAASPGGKRYDPNMSSGQRKDYNNGIWLCRTHAALIDRDEKYFTAEMLRKWKNEAENAAGKELTGEKIVHDCKFRMLVFYKDLLECKKGIEMLSEIRGLIIDSTLLPVQNQWEEHLCEIAELIGPEIASELFVVLRELEEFKNVMDGERKRFKGMMRRADNYSVQYCGRYDLFMERMEKHLSCDFLDSIRFFTELY